jgi:hypothetical protein
MRKQVDFVVRSWEFGNGANGTKTSAMVSEEIRENYLNKGYEVFSTPGVLQITAGVINFSVCFVKYEDEVAKSK